MLRSCRPRFPKPTPGPCVWKKSQREPGAHTRADAWVESGTSFIAPVWRSTIPRLAAFPFTEPHSAATLVPSGETTKIVGVKPEGPGNTVSAPVRRSVMCRASGEALGAFFVPGSVVPNHTRWSPLATASPP